MIHRSLISDIEHVPDMILYPHLNELFMRRPADWMGPIEDRILEVLKTTGLVLSPSFIPYNIDKSREKVNRCLTKLEDWDLVSKVGRGKYRIYTKGERYLEGQYSLSEKEEK